MPETQDWEPIDDETPPPHLQEKWDREEQEEAGTITCSQCGKLNKKDALSCIYCESKLHVDSGFLGWISYITTRSFIGFVGMICFLVMLVWLFTSFY